MNRFFKTLLIVFASVFVILSAYKMRRVVAMRTSTFSISPSYRTIVVGSSLGSADINDSILCNWKNLCVSGSDYTQNVAFLRKILRDNKQIDTVMIVCSPQSFFLYRDNAQKGIQVFNEYEYFYANYQKEDLQYVLDNPNFYCSFFTNDIFAIRSVTNSPRNYGFSNNAINVLKDSNAQWGVKWYDDYLANAEDKEVSLDVILQKRHLQVMAFEKMLQLCKENNKRIVLFSPPLFRYEKWFRGDGFIDYLGTLDESILFADYQQLQFPDLSYYKDVHHLSAKGANYLSSYIMEHRLQAKCLGDFVREKRMSSRIH